MTIKTILLSAEKAAFIQENADKYDCNLVETTMAGKNEHTLKQSVKVTVMGQSENVNKLFNQIGE